MATHTGASRGVGATSGCQLRLQLARGFPTKHRLVELPLKAAVSGHVLTLVKLECVLEAAVESVRAIWKPTARGGVSQTASSGQGWCCMVTTVRLRVALEAGLVGGMTVAV